MKSSILLTLAAVAFCITSGARAQIPVPDRILYGGTILTMARDGRIAEAIAIHADSILAVGSNEEILGLAGESTVQLDLEGRTLIPGFVDAHNHLFGEAENQGRTLSDAQGVAFLNGVTTVANLYTTRDLVDRLKAFEADGRLRLRTSLYLARTDFCGVDLGEWYLDLPPTHDRRGPLRIGGVKVFADGGICGQPATSFRSRGRIGNLWRSQQALDQLISEIDAHGYQIAVHAEGDRAVHQVLNAYEALLHGRPNVLRHRIDHNSFVSAADLPRYEQLGVPAVIFGTVATCAEVRYGALTNRYGESAHHFQDWRALLDANPGGIIGWHSDTPFLILDPIRHLYSYVTKIELDAEGVACYPPAWLEEHEISVEEALRLMTLGAAETINWDHDIGSLEPGKLADMVVLSQDPTSVPKMQIIDTKILATYVGGGLAYCSRGSEVLCGLPVSTSREVSDIPGDAGPIIRGVYPSPIRASAQIELQFDEDEVGHVDAAVYDILGRRVATLLSGDVLPGPHRLRWDADNGQSSGIYFLRVATDRGIESTSLILER